MLHWHHIVPLHAGGTDDPSNLKQITLEEHAEAHKLLWEKSGAWQDWCAWKGLSSAIGQEEIRSLIAKITGRLGGLAIRGKPKSETHKARMLCLIQCFKKGHTPWNTAKSWDRSIRDKISKSLTGRTQSQETISKRANSNRHPREKYNCKGQPSLCCPHCGKVGHSNPMRRWHFNNCKMGGLR